MCNNAYSGRQGCRAKCKAVHSANAYRTPQAVLSSSSSTARRSALDAPGEAGSGASAAARRESAGASAPPVAARSTRSASSSAESSAREYKSSATLRSVPGRSSSLTSRMLNEGTAGCAPNASAPSTVRHALGAPGAPAGEQPRERAARHGRQVLLGHGQQCKSTACPHHARHGAGAQAALRGAQVHAREQAAAPADLLERQLDEEKRLRAKAKARMAGDESAPANAAAGRTRARVAAQARGRARLRQTRAGRPKSEPSAGQGAAATAAAPPLRLGFGMRRVQHASAAPPTARAGAHHGEAARPRLVRLHVCAGLRAARRQGASGGGACGSAPRFWWHTRLAASRLRNAERLRPGPAASAHSSSRFSSDRPAEATPGRVARAATRASRPATRGGPSCTALRGAGCKPEAGGGNAWQRGAAAARCGAVPAKRWQRRIIAAWSAGDASRILRALPARELHKDCVQVAACGTGTSGARKGKGRRKGRGG